MPDRIPHAQAIRISNALGNLGSASLALEGLVVDREICILDLVETIREIDESILGKLSTRSSRTIDAVLGAHEEDFHV